MTQPHPRHDPRTFEHWWADIGSKLGPMPDHDCEEHGHRIARLAWIACSRQVIPPPDASMPF